MLKRTTLAAALALAAMSAPASATFDRDCLGLERAGKHVASAVDRTGREIHRAGDHIVKAGDRLIRLIFCDKRRRA